MGAASLKLDYVHESVANIQTFLLHTKYLRKKCGEGCWYRVGARHYVQRRCLFNWYGIQIVIGVAYQLNMERRKARKGCGGRKKKKQGVVKIGKGDWNGVVPIALA